MQPKVVVASDPCSPISDACAWVKTINTRSLWGSWPVGDGPSTRTGTHAIVRIPLASTRYHLLASET